MSPPDTAGPPQPGGTPSAMGPPQPGGSPSGMGPPRGRGRPTPPGSASPATSPPGRAGRSLRALVLALVVVASAACSDLTGVAELRAGFTPPATYEALWTRLEACAEREADFDRIRWYWIGSFPDRTRVLGQWNERHEITLSTAVIGNGAVVAHEMLHDLLGGDREHRDPAWQACRVPRGEG